MHKDNYSSNGSRIKELFRGVDSFWTPKQSIEITSKRDGVNKNISYNFRKND